MGRREEGNGRTVMLTSTPDPPQQLHFRDTFCWEVPPVTVPDRTQELWPGRYPASDAPLTPLPTTRGTRGEGGSSCSCLTLLHHPGYATPPAALIHPSDVSHSDTSLCFLLCGSVCSFALFTLHTNFFFFYDLVT